jgi:tetratricopeptide (TPR) repeat protein
MSSKQMLWWDYICAPLKDVQFEILCLINCGEFEAVLLELDRVQRDTPKVAMTWEMELWLAKWFSRCHIHMKNYVTALWHTKRIVVLAALVHGTISYVRAGALRSVGDLQIQLKAFDDAGKRYNDAMIIMEKLELTADLEYGRILAGKARLIVIQGHYPEALEMYNSAAEVLKKTTDRRTYALIISSMAACCAKMKNYSRAFALANEAVQVHHAMGEVHSLRSSIAIAEVGRLLFTMKEFDLAIPPLEVALTVLYRTPERKEYNHTSIILTDARKCALNRNAIPADCFSNHRLCVNCQTIAPRQQMLDNDGGVCPRCFLVWYCCEACREAHQPTHECVARNATDPIAPRCGACSAVNAPLRCSCLGVRYCNVECQYAHWKTHKASCALTKPATQK